MVLILSFLFGCGAETDPVLPPSQIENWVPQGRMVAAAGVRGYLVHPKEVPAAGLLLLVPSLDDTTKASAHRQAGKGFVVLAITPETEPERAHNYLSGFADIRGVSSLCQMEDCP